MKKALTLLFLCVLSSVTVVALADEPNKDRFSLSVHGGYANMLDGTKGLTSTSESYVNSLSSGFSWDAQYCFKHRKLALGLLYSGYTSKGKLPDSSDHLYTNYVAPFIGLYLFDNEKFSARATLGIGRMYYRNNSTVFGKERIVTGHTLGQNYGLNGVYFLSPKLGISIDIQHIGSEIYDTSVKYHGERIVVKFPLENPLSLTRLNISAGLAYFF
jgi:hypothetical protein